MDPQVAMTWTLKVLLDLMPKELTLQGVQSFPTCILPGTAQDSFCLWGGGLTCTLQTRPRWLSDLSLNNSVGSMEIKQEIFLLKDNTLQTYGLFIPLILSLMQP